MKVMISIYREIEIGFENCLKNVSNKVTTTNNKTNTETRYEVEQISLVYTLTIYS